MFDAHLHGPWTSLGAVPDNWKGIMVSSGPEEWPYVKEIYKKPGFSPMFGLLPQAIAKAMSPIQKNSLIDHIDSLLSSYPHSGIGEIGLDTRMNRLIPMDVQITFCEQLVDLAIQHHVPITFHAVRCDGTLVDLIKKMRPKVPMLWHGYLGSIETAKQACSLGCTVSIGLSLYRPNTKLHRKISTLNIPFMLETDYPWHYSLPGESKCSYKELLVHHYARCARILGLPCDQLEKQLDGIGKIFTDFSSDR